MAVGGGLLEAMVLVCEQVSAAKKQRHPWVKNESRCFFGRDWPESRGFGGGGQEKRRGGELG